MVDKGSGRQRHRDSLARSMFSIDRTCHHVQTRTRRRLGHPARRHPLARSRRRHLRRVARRPIAAIARHAELHAAATGVRGRQHPTALVADVPWTCSCAAPREGVRDRPQLRRTRRERQWSRRRAADVHQVPRAASSAPPRTSCCRCGLVDWEVELVVVIGRVAATSREMTPVARAGLTLGSGHLRSARCSSTARRRSSRSARELRHLRPPSDRRWCRVDTFPIRTTWAWCDVAGERMQDARTNDLIFERRRDWSSYLSLDLHPLRRRPHLHRDTRRRRRGAGRSSRPAKWSSRRRGDRRAAQPLRALRRRPDGPASPARHAHRRAGPGRTRRRSTASSAWASPTTGSRAAPTAAAGDGRRAPVPADCSVSRSAPRRARSSTEIAARLAGLGVAPRALGDGALAR